jgi:UPF0716 protein FxsA
VCGLLALLFIAVPILEIWLILQVGSVLGVPATLGVIVLTALVGAWLARLQGFVALRDIQRALLEGRRVGAALAGAAIVLACGLLLLTPGFATDAVGIALLLPPVRARVAAALARRLVRRVVPREIVVVDLGAEAIREEEGEPGSGRERGGERDDDRDGDRDRHEPPPPGVIDV